jgi:hypothetical protein
VRARAVFVHIGFNHSDALAAIDAKILDAESRLVADAERIAREKECKKRQAALIAARDAFVRFKEAAAEMTDALKLLASCGPACVASAANLEYFSAELPKGIQSGTAILARLRQRGRCRRLLRDEHFPAGAKLIDFLLDVRNTVLRRFEKRHADSSVNICERGH